MIIEWIPSLVCKKLSDISSDKEHVGKVARVDDETLKKRGFNEALKLSSTIFTMRQKEEEEWGRNIILFSAPFSNNVKNKC